MTDRYSPDLHIAVLAFPFGTHAAPLLTLVRRLAASAPKTTRFSFFNTAQSNKSLSFSGTKPDEFANIKSYNVWDGGAPEGHVCTENILETVALFLQATPGNFNKVMEEAEKETGVKITCLLTDAFWWFAADLAEEMKVPWVPLWTSGSFALSSMLYADFLRKTQQGSSGVAENVDQALKLIPGMSKVHIEDLPDGVLHGGPETPFTRMIYRMTQKLPKATALVVNSFEELDPSITEDLKSKLQKVLHIGPTTLSSSPPPSDSDDKSGCLAWLDKHEAASVAYISFGSFTTLPPNELQALAQAMQDSKVPFIWSLKDHSRHLLPQGFLESTEALGFGKVVSWAPQVQVLEHPAVGAFVTHCGWNSVLESITGGVPLICRPFFGDQPLNSRMVQDVWRIGVKVEGGVFTKSGTTSALELVLASDEGKKMRQNIGVLKQRAVEAVGPNGSSTANFKALLEISKTCRHN